MLEKNISFPWSIRLCLPMSVLHLLYYFFSYSTQRIYLFGFLSTTRISAMRLYEHLQEAWAYSWLYQLLHSLLQESVIKEFNNFSVTCFMLFAKTYFSADTQ